MHKGMVLQLEMIKQCKGNQKNYISSVDGFYYLHNVATRQI